MKAAICSKYGAPEVLQIKEIEKPVPKHNEILIKIIATSVTASDCIVRSLNLPPLMKLSAQLALGFKKPKKQVLGLVLSGIIESVGNDTTLFKQGDKVFAHTFIKFGANAEYICVDEKSCVYQMPANLSYEEAAAIPYGGTLALYFLNKAKITKGQNVLIYGASGAIGTLAVQIANYFGAAVDGICGPSNLELVKNLGANLVFDYTSKNMKLENKKYDLIFDAVGKNKSKGFEYKNALKKDGRFISVDDANPGKKAVNKEYLKLLKEMAENMSIKPVIDKTYKLEQIVEAHTYVDKGHKKGNVIITI
jgi:alcohol dehydrogenase